MVVSKRYLYFLGGAEEVGKNSVLYIHNKKIAIDHGLKLFSDVLYPLPLKNPDAIVISHAHLDHSGHVPNVYTNHRPQILTTKPTKELVNILWEDNAKIMGSNLMYPKRNIKIALSNVVDIKYNTIFNIDSVNIELFDAGHILGSGLVSLTDDELKILYTCDMNSSDTRMHVGCKPIKADVLILESTYAQKDHGDRKEKEKLLCEKAQDIAKKGGTLILPSFAVGRTQELIAVLSNIGCDLYVDGMGNKINEIYLKHRELINDFYSFKRGMRAVNVVYDKSGRKKAMKGAVIITTAGMLEGGPALHYIMNSKKNSEVIFTGYCVEGTNGWKLQHNGYIELNGTQINVDIPVSYLDFSAHSGRCELFEFAKKCDPSKIFCMHGDNCHAFADELRQLGFDAIAPENGKKYEIEL